MMGNKGGAGKGSSHARNRKVMMTTVARVSNKSGKGSGDSGTGGGDIDVGGNNFIGSGADNCNHEST